MEARVTIVGASTRDLEEMLRPAGVKITSVPDLAGTVPPSGEPPNAVLLDLRGNDGVPPSVADFTAVHPAIAVIVVAARLDAAMMHDAFNAGTRGFVPEPLTAKDLRAAVARVTAPAVRQPGKVLAFVGAKGGVGTTTLAVNIGTAAALLAKGDTLLIDLNARYGDAAACLGADPRFTVNDALENAHKLDMPLMRGLVLRTSADMDVLAASDRPMPSAAVPRLRALLDFAKREYHYTVLDLSRTDEAILDALDSVSTIVVVVSQEVTAVRNASRVVGSLRQRYGQERVQIAIGRLDRQAEISVQDVERALGVSVRVFSSDFRRAIDSLNCGRPLVLDNNSRLAVELKRFVRELAGVVVQDARPQRDSLLPKWLTGGRT